MTLRVLRPRIRGMAAGLFAAAAVALAGGLAAAQPTLGTVSFPGPSMSSQPIPIIKAGKLDEKNGWKVDWNIRTSVAAYLNDYYTNVYSSLHVSGVNYLVTNYNKGAPVRIIGGVLSFPYPVMTAINSGINKIEDLKGKRLGVPRGSYIYAYVVAALKAHNIDPDKDLKLENVDLQQAVQLLDRGDYDAVVTTPESAALLDMKSNGKFKPVFFPDEEVAKLLGVERMLLVFTVHADWAKQNPGMSPKLLATMASVQDFIDKNPAEAKAVLGAKNEVVGGKGQGGANMDSGVFDSMYVTGFFGRKMRWYGIPAAQLKEQFKKEFELYLAVGMIDKIPDDGIFLFE